MKKLKTNETEHFLYWFSIILIPILLSIYGITYFVAEYFGLTFLRLCSMRVLFGIPCPGCGKSDCARYTARTLGLPLLRMDIGSLMHMYQGESERELREALKLAETMAPCVLWIDEMDKGFSEVGKDGGSGSFMRMFGYLLSWMQDNTTPVFIFATANDIGGLPKEFFRSGRFEARYAVYLPTERECAAIIRACMKRAVKNTEAAPSAVCCLKTNAATRLYCVR